MTHPSDQAAWPPDPFRWWQLVGFTLVGFVVLVTLAGTIDTAVFTGLYVIGLVVWPTRWRFQRRVRGRPVWWLLLVWPLVPFTLVGMAVWAVIEAVGSLGF